MVFIIIISIFLILKLVNLSNIRKQQETLNTQSKEKIQELNLNLNKIFYLDDYATYNQPASCKQYISADTENKKFCLIDYDNGNLFVIGFEEFLNYSIYENGSQQTVGANISGLYTGLFGTETNGMCKDLKLIIRLNNYDNPQLVYNIISNTTFNIGINKSSRIYKQCIGTLQEVVSFLEVVKNDNIKK